MALALLGVVAIASTSRVDSGGWAPRAPIVVIVVAVVLVTALIVLVFASVFVTGYASFAGSRFRERALVVGIGGVVLASGIIVSLLPRWIRHKPWVFDRPPHCIQPDFWWFHYPNDRQEIFRHPDRFCPWGSGGGADKVAGLGGGGGGTPVALLAAVAGGSALVLIIAVAAVAIAVRRSRRVMRVSVEAEDAVVVALDESIDDLRRERDVRRAIIACYARMEGALERSGAGRQAQEAPFEYLGRVVGRLSRAADPLGVLTELFERAKFSLEPMGVSEKERAVAALEDVRMEVCE